MKGTDSVSEAQTHLCLHHRPNRKTVNLQDPVPDMDGVPHLRTEKHPSHSGNTQVQEEQENTLERADRHSGGFICSAGNGSVLLLDLDAGCAVDVPHDGHRQAPLPVGCRGHGDEGHRVGQRVHDRLVRAFLQHGREDHLLVTLSTATERREESPHV